MKTYSAPIQQNRQLKTTAGQKFIPAMVTSIRDILAVLGAMIIAAAIVLLSVWAAGMKVTAILSAGIWGLGFIFLGLAVDNRGPAAFLQLAIGVVLLALAWLQTTVSPDYTIVAGVVLATWAAVAVFRRLR